jgi:hypothetical protein
VSKKHRKKEIGREKDIEGHSKRKSEREGERDSV